MLMPNINAYNTLCDKEADWGIKKENKNGTNQGFLVSDNLQQAKKIIDHV